MAGLGSPLINGSFTAFADIELNLNGLLIAGVAAIDYDDNLARSKVYGTSSVPLGLTKGKYEATGSVELYLEAANLILTTYPGTWRMVPIIFNVSYVPFTFPATPVFDVIPVAYLTKQTSSNKVGDEATTRKFELAIPGQILWGGAPSFIESGATLVALG
jgi:hypothetical protein